MERPLLAQSGRTTELRSSGVASARWGLSEDCGGSELPHCHRPIFISNLSSSLFWRQVTVRVSSSRSIICQVWTFIMHVSGSGVSQGAPAALWPAACPPAAACWRRRCRLGGAAADAASCRALQGPPVGRPQWPRRALCTLDSRATAGAGSPGTAGGSQRAARPLAEGG